MPVVTDENAVATPGTLGNVGNNSGASTSSYLSGLDTNTNPGGQTTSDDTTSQPTSLDRLSNSILGANLAAQEQGSKDILDAGTSGLGNFFTKGVPLIPITVANSFLNTAVEVGNVFGGDFQKATIENELGPDSDYTKYYQQHSGLLEGLGFAAGSLIPGIGAVKVLKLAQAGEFGSTLSTATGLFSRIGDKALLNATTDLAGNATGTSLFGLNTANKITAVLAGAADQALQGAVFQTAALATMHASPIVDNNTLSDNVSDVLDAMKGFGLVGGLFEGASAISKINKAAKVADLASKSSEIVASQGLANLTPGDRIVTLSKGIDAAAASTPADSRLAQMKLIASNNTATRQITEQFIKAADGDEELGGSLTKFLLDGKASGNLTDEALGNTFSNLAKIGRLGDTNVVSQPSDVFYLPKSVAPEDVATIDHSQLLNRSVPDSNPLAKAFQLKDPNTLPVIGRATEGGLLLPTAPGAQPTPYLKYAGAMDAYRQGVDIYLDANGGVHVNPAYTNFKEVPRPGESRTLTPQERKVYETTGNLPADSKPLLSVPLFMDLKSGTQFGEPPVPVVGDIGKPQLVPSGLKLKDTGSFFPQKADGADFSPSNPLDANARYVWAYMRGIKPGDKIASNDLPMLEQMWRDMSAGHDVISGNGLSNFTDGTAIPIDKDSLLQHITATKQSMLGDLLTQGKNADEIGNILNTPQQGITKMFNSSVPQDVMLDPAQHMQINHVRMQYDIGTTRDSEGNLLRGLQNTSYRLQLAKEANTTAVSNYLARTIGQGDATGNLAGKYLSSLQFTKGVGQADILGAGNGFLTSANADYGTVAQQAERIGRATGELSLARQAVVADSLSKVANGIRNADPAIANEWGNFVSVRQSTSENYVALPDDVAAANGLGRNVAILEKAVTKDSKTGAITIDKSYIPNGFAPGGPTAVGGNKLLTYYNLSDPVMAIEKQSQALNNARNTLRDQWWQAQGISKPGYNPDVLYTPPINTANQPFFAYVRQREGYALGESGASVITARSAEELQQKISLLGPEWDAFSKQDIANFKKAQGEYEFNRNFMTNKVNTELARKGILNNVVPETRAANLINDLAGWHFQQETQLLRDHVELHNAETFAQLRAMGDRFDLVGNSKFGAITPFTKKNATNPFRTYINTALGISNSENYPLWQLAQEKLQNYGDTAFNAVKDAFGATRKGLVPVEEAAKVSERFGLGNPYGTAVQSMQDSYYGGMANKLPSPRILSRFVATANSALGATVIRLDSFQQLIHAVTMPIMTSMEYMSATKDLQDLLSTTVPGTKIQAPSFVRTLYNAVGNYFGDSYERLLNLYSAAGLTRDELQTHRQMIDQLSMPAGKLSDEGWAQKIDKGASLAEKLVGTKFVNKFNHFVIADVGRQLGEAAGLKGQDLLDTIGTFTNRALGNMAAGQRASVFTGPVGQAIGLFQSYQMNMMQQLFRHIGDGDVRALAIGAGMQSTIFGLSSLPGFQALNNLIQERHGNTAHQDIFSGTNEATGHTIADYLLYGSLSGLLGTALYSRGDLNPRRASILPVNPLNFPSVAAGVRIYQTLDQLQSNIAKGGSVPTSLLLAAEHNGLSRPLTGLAEMMQGFTTSSNGNLISALPQSTDGSNSAGYSDLFSIANMSRLLGARPLEEAVGLDALYRNTSAKVTDLARMQALGDAAKTELYNGGSLAPEATQNFMSAYAAAGGRQEGFNSWMLGIARDANVSAVNRTFTSFTQPFAQTMQKTMGGVPLPDYRNTGSLAPASVDTMSPDS